MALLWAFPTPHAISVVELDWELSHPDSNCNESLRLAFYFSSEFESTCTSYERSKCRFFFFFGDHIDFPNCFSLLNLEWWWCLCFELISESSIQDEHKGYELGNRRSPREHRQPQVVTLALEPVTQRNHLLEGRADDPRPLKFEFMAPKI